MEEIPQKAEVTGQELPKRHFLLTICCLFSSVFFGFVSILFLLAVFYSGWIAEVVNKYTPENNESPGKLTAFIIAGFLLHAACFTGIIMMWMMKRKGYFVFALSALVITAYQLFQTKISFTTTAIYILLVLLFGLFYKKFR
jgi:hypothetical protein